MRTIVHLSDLHFGRVDPAILTPLRDAVRELTPDLVAVSGDLTQRARVEQFKQVRAFLDSLPTPQIVVPGNHDVPLFNPFERFLGKLSRFQTYITQDLKPTYIDDEIAVLGVNTARALTWKGGRINRGQANGIYERFCKVGESQCKIVVTHHPFDLPEGFAARDLVGRARMAMELFARCGVDLFLAGHLHLTHAGGTERYAIEGFSALVVQAGTATSTRGRGEMNSFNVVRVERELLAIETYSWDNAGKRFQSSANKSFRRTAEGWRP